jgi:hypothetical protein
MVHQIETNFPKDLPDLRVPDIHLQEGGLGWDVLPLSATQVIHHPDPITPGQKGVCHVAADESSAAGYEDGLLRVIHSVSGRVRVAGSSQHLK